MKDTIHMCTFRTVPMPTGPECWTAIWSRGASCHSCGVDCYRKGWTVSQATVDNKRIVKEKVKL